MASMLTNNKQTTKERMLKRRGFVFDAIRRVCPQTRDQAWLEREVRLQKHATYKTLFERMGYDDPSVGTSTDFIAWNIDCGLWNGFHNSPMDNTAFIELFDQRPSPTNMPYSQEFRQYQLDRLGQKAEDVPMKQAKTEAGSLKRKPDDQDDKTNNFQPLPKKWEQQDLEFTTRTEASREPQQTGNKPTTNKPKPTPAPITPKAQGKRPLHIDTYPGPFPGPNNNNTTDFLSRLQTLTTTRQPAPPRNPAAWPRYIWRAIYADTPPPRDGDFFALRLREAWLPHVDAAVLRRAHALLEPTVRVQLRQREELVVVGKGEDGEEVKEWVTVRLLAVAVVDRAEVTSLRGLGYLAEVWGDVCEWHTVMVGSGQGGGCDLDGFMRERLLHRVAVGFAGVGLLCGRE
jgi:hypothetical protein